MVERTFASDPNPIADLAKGYALAEAAGGVPLTEQPHLVGAAASLRYLATTSVVGAGGWPSAQLLGTPVLATDDILVLTASGQRYAIDRQRFLALTPAHVAGDDLIISDLLGSGDTDVRSITSEDGTHTVLVARTADNRPLWQAASTGDSVEAGEIYQVYAEKWTGGLIGQRYNELRSHIRTTAILRQRSAAEPTAPPTSVTFDGQYPRNAGAWSALDEPEPAGTDPIWWATAEVSYSSVTAMYSFDAWQVVREDSAFDLQFAVSENGPWHSPRVGADTWARERRHSGGFNVFRLAPDEDRRWRRLVTVQIPDHAAASYSQALEFDFTPSDFSLIQFSWWRGQFFGNERTGVVQATHSIVVRRGGQPATRFHGQSWYLSFPQTNAPVANQTQTGNPANTGNTYIQKMILDFYREDTASFVATHVYVRDLGYRRHPGYLEILVY